LFVFALLLGFVGGGEQFDYYIGEHCEKLFRSQNPGLDLPPSTKQDFVNDFHTKKQYLGPDFRTDRGNGKLALSSYSSDINPISLEPEDIEAAFNKALHEPLEQANLILSEATKTLGCRGERGPWAMITGGTAQTSALRARLEAMCEEKKLRPPKYIDDESPPRYRYVLFLLLASPLPGGKLATAVVGAWCTLTGNFGRVAMASVSIGLGSHFSNIGIV
jgi:hypothetical protein